MSFKAKLKVGGNEYNVLNCSYKLHQDCDQTGRPSSVTRGGAITMTTESTADTFLSDWIINSWDRKSGSVVFLKRDTDATSKEIKFEEAYMVDFEEKFDSTGDNPMTETFTISAQKLGVGNAEHVNEWPT